MDDPPLDASMLGTNFVPDESQSVPIRAAIASQRKHIVEIDSEIEQLERQVQELNRQQEVVQDALAVNKAFLAPVRRVAPEILAKIFEHCLSQELERASTLDPPLLLMHVSRRWRTVAQGTPRLWLQIVVNSRTRKPYAEMWMENSDLLPLSVAVNLGDIGTTPAAVNQNTAEEAAGWGQQGAGWGDAGWGHPGTGWGQHSDDEGTFPIPKGNLEVIQMFIEQLPRIRRFELHCSYSVLRMIFPTGMRRNLACLEELAVSCSNFPRRPRLDPSPDFYHVEETRLHTLRISENLFTMVSIKPTSNLRVLTLLSREPMSQVSKFLRLCPGLEDLVIKDASLNTYDAERDAQNLEPDPIVLPNLWKLEIGWQTHGWGRGGDDVATYGPFLRSLHTPSVRILVLQHFRGEKDELYHLFTYCASSLRHLTLEGLSCNPYQFYRMMKDSTGLETLTLKRFKGRGVWEPFTPEKDSPPNLWLCPKLHSLKCSGFSVGKDFVNFVQHRIAPSQQGALGSIPHATGFNYITNITIETGDATGTFSILQELQSQGHGLILTGIPRHREGYQDWGSASD